MARDFAKERDEARQMTEQITATLSRQGFDAATITADWQHYGRQALVLIEGREAGDLIQLSNLDDEETLRMVQTRLLEAIAQEQLHSKEPAMRWTSLRKPEDAPATIQSLWRVHLSDDTLPGVNVAEYLSDGRRWYEPFDGGPQPGAHQFFVDALSEQARTLIQQSGGTVKYDPEARRVDKVRGREWVVLPEGTTQHGSDELMSAQQFRLPTGKILILMPRWYTVDLFVQGEIR